MKEINEPNEGKRQQMKMKYQRVIRENTRCKQDKKKIS